MQNLTSHLRQSVFLNQRQYGSLHRSQCGREVHHHTRFAIFELLLFVRCGEHLKHHTIDSDRRLDHIRHVALTRLRIEILDLLAREFLVVAQIEVGTRVDTLHLLEPEREFILHVSRGIGIMCQLLVIVETVVFVAETKCTVPLHPNLLPLLEPSELLTRPNKELHLHLLELTHPEDELTGYDLIPEGLSDLCDTERNLHTARFLDIQEVYEDTLCRLGSQIDRIGPITD